MDDPVHLGYVFDDLIQIIGFDPDLHANNSNTAMIANVDAKIMEGEKIIYRATGQVWLIDIDFYDLVVFSELRKMFGFDFPRVAVINYRGVDYITVPRFGDRELRENDYWPHTTENTLFRFNLALIIYFCKLIGCPFNLKDVRVLNGVPFFWKGRSLGYRNTGTVTSIEFEKIFGLSLETLKRGEGNTLSYEVIKYFREVDFDTDVLRGILYVKDSVIRYRKGTRIKYQLTRVPKIIEELIEENHSLLLSEYPFNIFSSYVGRPKHDYLYFLANNKVTNI